MTDQAIIEAAERFSSGDVVDQSKKFAPTVPEFVEEVRRRQEFVELRRPRIAPPRYVPGPLAPFEIRRQRLFAEYSDRPVIAEGVSLETFRTLSQQKQIPAGAAWVAALGIIYGKAAA